LKGPFEKKDQQKKPPRKDEVGTGKYGMLCSQLPPKGKDTGSPRVRRKDLPIQRKKKKRGRREPGEKEKKVTRKEEKKTGDPGGVRKQVVINQNNGKGKLP